MAKGYKKWLLLGDTHGKDADIGVLNIIHQFSQDWQPDRVVHAGDFGNFDWASEYVSEESNALAELDFISSWISKLGITDFMAGNHEGRLSRLGARIPKGFKQLADIPKFLNLKKRKVNWYPYESTSAGVLNIGKLAVVHGWWYNKYCAAKHAEAYGCCMHFHSHRYQIYSSFISGENQTGFSVPCTCNLHLPYDKNLPPRGHMQGFAIVYEYPNGFFNANIIPIVGDKVVILDKVYKRKSR